MTCGLLPEAADRRGGEADIETALKYPWISFGSDAAASPELVDPNTIGMGHPRGYGNFPRVIAKYVREKKVIMLPEAIQKMTRGQRRGSALPPAD